MKSDQLIAALLLGLGPQTMAVVVKFEHASAPAIRDAIDPTTAGGHSLVQYSPAHTKMAESQKEVQRLELEAQRGPPDIPPSPFTFGFKDEQADSSHIGESADSSELKILPSDEKVNRKVYGVGSQTLPERQLRGVGGHAGKAGKGGKKRAGNSGSENSASFSYMLSLIGLLVNFPLLGRLFTR
ncbi:uncharacterized protein MELLADRAFT_124375 [Melampsora larici-populina 98AG31]|uniref:Secreted protein n=1 Tax=Melampsora larici-populina (strain 98AG31 / pathotype 3-4-7) TaxID=747676 RepID=F4RMK4_MELLP|nr:uncharacterized protein MELLADRAFT_124375 [Melampsora larici-populina 98AG31]EGG06452.1 secreted protein [Melampsora larici-populina 98AG31]